MTEAPESDPQNPERRTAVILLYAFLGAVLGPMGAVALPYLAPPSKPRSGSGWADAGDLRSVKPGRPRQVSILHSRKDGWVTSSQRFGAWIVAHEGRDTVAFSPRCPHLGCGFRWDEALGQFICPCHDSRFDIDGRRLSGPAQRGLDRYEVKVIGNRLWLRLEVEDVRDRP